MEDLKFSLFLDKQKGIESVVPKKTIGFKELVEVYKSAYLIDKTAELRSETNEAKRKELKKHLPFITSSGCFTYRNSKNIIHHNKSLIALDLDNLTEDTAIDVKAILAKQPSVLLASISPRGKGVKALVLISAELAPETRYQTLKIARSVIAIELGIVEYLPNIDTAQFVLPQPFFLSHDATMYVNEQAQPLQITFVDVTEKPKQLILTRDRVKIPTAAKNRVEIYLINATKLLAYHLQTQPEGSRHFSISKVATIKGILHYAPQMESEVKAILWNAICISYGTEHEALLSGAGRSIKTIWDKSPNLHNDTLDSIINEFNAVAI
ncbi:MAG: VirE N-terminal domain [Bacteroidota bacterium]|jgi:hypothetical protein